MSKKIQMTDNSTVEMYLGLTYREAESGREVSGEELNFSVESGPSYDDGYEGRLGVAYRKNPLGGYEANTRHHKVRNFLMEQGYIDSPATGVINLTKKGREVL